MLDPTLTGTLALDSAAGHEALLDHLANCLRQVDARRVQISPDSVTFRGGMFRLVGKMNMLVPFGHGELMVGGPVPQVRYRLSIRQLLSVMTVVVGFAAVLAWLATGGDILFPLLVLGFGWLWLVGLNLLIGLFRFRRFLRRSIDSLPRSR